MIFLFVLIFLMGLAWYWHVSTRGLSKMRWINWLVTGKNIRSSEERKGECAVFPTDDVDWCQTLRDNTEMIREEFFQYAQSHAIPSFGQVDPDQQNLAGSTWWTLFLRKYGKTSEVVNAFPKTIKLIDDCVPSCSLVMFSILAPGKVIVPHCGPYLGVLRYHLALVVPEDAENCWIEVKGPEKTHRYSWQVGSDFLFDDTFVHYVENKTKETRIILFLDVAKPMDNPLRRLVAKCAMWYMSRTRKIRMDIDSVNQKNQTVETIKEREHDR